MKIENRNNLTDGENTMQSFGSFDEREDRVPGMGEDYDLAFAEDMEIDEKLLASFKKTARELGIPHGKAQKLADMYAERIAESMQESDAAMAGAKKKWESTIMSRPGFRQELPAAQKVLKEYGNDELPDLLRQSLLGSHPAFFDFMVKVAGAIKSSSMGASSTSPAQRGVSLADKLWPDKPAAKPRSGGKTAADRMWPDMEWLK
ncbi:hypothetical protein LJC46_03320 [Desulfovibrio sp. OttesenSCG-928-G15]|nr:hypothetical protein [Desulfovibrio sp. OttesenSCG-928-G15]